MDWVIGLDLPEAGQLVQSRITGAFEGVRAGHPELPVEVVRAHRRARDAGQEQEAGRWTFCNGTRRTNIF